jgi:hypothetical protein
MSDQPNEGPRARGTLKLVAYPFIFLVLYVLSIGPAARMGQANILPMPLIISAYKPLSIVCRHSNTAEKLLVCYLFEVWGCRMD